MDIYLVGGAVRDELLGLDIKERDWVVVGAAPDDLLSQGYKSVGKDFPVFLHPSSKEEYALARTERKTAPGYTGFAVEYSPKVTLEEDLRRRDLTINAIAKDNKGNIIDPYNGRKDLEDKILRHVSTNFTEDPVRILRLARFAARFHYLGFKVASETNELMKEMVLNGEIDALVAERVWKETERALAEQSPQFFFETLRTCQALKVLFPELDKLYGIPNPPQHHPEIDTGIHTMMVLEQAAKISSSPRVRFAALLHDLGKATTPRDLLPRHHGHEQRGTKIATKLCERYKVPKSYQKLAIKVAEYHGVCHRAFELRADTIARLLKQLDAFRNPDDFFDFLLACIADSRGRTGFENREYKQADYLTACYQAARYIKSTPFMEQGFEGEALAKEMYKAQIEAIKQVKAAFEF